MIFPKQVKVVNIGLPNFSSDMEQASVDVIHLDWRPPAGADEHVLSLLEQLEKVRDKIDAANDAALGKVLTADPVLTGLGLAEETIPGLTGHTILHAGPPVPWAEMCGPVRGAIIGAIRYEQWADSPEAAIRLAESGKITFAPCHHFGAVGPMSGVLSPTMPVFIVENRSYGNRAYASINEGLGQVLRFGAFGEEVLERLRWLRDKLFPVIRDAVSLKRGLSLRKKLRALAILELES